MKRPPILLSSHVLAAGFAACAWCGPAHADVLEIGVDGAQWIAGPAMSEAVVPLSASYDAVPEDLAVPAEALADTADDGSAIPAAYAAKVDELARRFDLSPALLEAVVWQESRW